MHQATTSAVPGPDPRNKPLACGTTMTGRRRLRHQMRRPVASIMATITNTDNDPLVQIGVQRWLRITRYESLADFCGCTFNSQKLD
jgi:hypothetical protein